MADYKIQLAFRRFYPDYSARFNPSPVKIKAASSIMNCKSGSLGYSKSVCQDCGYSEIHNNSCRNRSCPCCQGFLKELWIDQRKAEVIDAPYFHVVVTLPSELNPILYQNQELLYPLLHKCVSRSLLELSSNRKYLGAVPGIIQVLHTWGQELNFHPHIHCIVSGAGLSPDRQLVRCGKHFFLPVRVLGKKFRGIFLASLQKLFAAGRLSFSGDILHLRNSYDWNAFRDSLYKKDWLPFVKETFNGFGNAIDYLGRYTHRIAISNSRILSVSDSSVSFSAKDYRSGNLKTVSLDGSEFIRRFLLHVLPSGFQKIRYYGFLNNRFKRQNLLLISRLSGKQLFQPKLTGLKTDELLLVLLGKDVHVCPVCGCNHLQTVQRTFPLRN
jgi:hypothetical protein